MASKAPIIPLELTNGRGRCSVCLTLGTPGASCDACWSVAYDRELARVVAAEHQAITVHGRYCDLVAILRSVRDGLLAAHDGHAIIRQIFPGARMQAPEAP